MKARRSDKLLVESPASATGDIAFNLIVFFLVCASVQPDSGRKQIIPKAEEVQQEQKESENVTVDLTRTSVAINGEVVKLSDFGRLLKIKLQGKTAEEDRVVVIKQKPDTPYAFYIQITTLIDDAGGIAILQVEEEREVTIPG